MASSSESTRARVVGPRHDFAAPINLDQWEIVVASWREKSYPRFDLADIRSSKRQQSKFWMPLFSIRVASMAKIEHYVKPHRLYRYRSSEHVDRELETIEQAYLFCSAYKDLNDPMEGFYSSTQKLKNSDKYAVVRSEILFNKRNIGICSFSEVYNNELMWAHYASDFGGICIAYDLFDLLKHMPDDARFVRMYYNEEAPNIGLSRTPTDELAKRVLSYKNHRWLYEREWRMFSQQGQVHYRDPQCVARVYIGSRIDSEQRNHIEKRLAPLKIPLSRMVLSDYSMTFKPGLKSATRSARV
jgi:hypothetical protein